MFVRDTRRDYIGIQLLSINLELHPLQITQLQTKTCLRYLVHYPRGGHGIQDGLDIV